MIHPSLSNFQLGNSINSLSISRSKLLSAFFNTTELMNIRFIRIGERKTIDMNLIMDELKRRSQ